MVLANAIEVKQTRKAPLIGGGIVTEAEALVHRADGTGFLYQFQLFQPYPVAAHLCKVVLRLFAQPSLLRCRRKPWTV
jgi:hypothetical protein